MASNRLLKNWLIGQFREKICFTYPSNEFPKMFYSGNVSQEVMVENLRRPKSKEYVSGLRTKFMEYDCGLSSSYCDPNDVNISSDNFKRNC